MGGLSKLREKMASLNVDGFMITDPWNRRYLSGFTGSNGVIIVSPTEARLITDYRYVKQAQQQTTGYEVVLHAGHTGHKGLIFDEVARQVNKMRIEKLAFEEDHLSYGFFRKNKAIMDTELVPTSGVIEHMRMIKSEEEIQLLKVSAEITDAAFTHIVKEIRPGKSEMDIADELDFFIRSQGAVTSTFTPIVASGYRSALPHGRASEKIIEAGDMVTIDFGCNYKGYWSDISRTVAVGKPPEQLKEIHDVVLKSFSRCVEELNPGLTDQEVDGLMRDHIVAHGYNDYSGTGTGHGIGLEVHELPLFSIKKDKVLKPGMVITVEPGIYIDNLGGVRIEDVILITESGRQVLTPSSKDLIVL